MAKKPEPLTGEEELQNVLRMSAYLGCTGTHRTASGRLMPCASPESLARISNRAEPEKKGSRKKRRTRFEKLRERGVRGIDTLPGGGLVSAPIVIKVAKDSPRAKRRKARSDREAATPAPLKDRIFGSSKNPRGTARSVGSASDIEMTAAVEQALKNKVNQHNEKMRATGKPQHTMASLRALKSVYRRGAGAFSVSHRPGKTRGQWAMARVNAFLYLLEKGRPRNVRYVTDNDLLPNGHPKSTKWMFVHPELKAIGRRGLRRLAGGGAGRRGGNRGRGFRQGNFDSNAEDRDGDGKVQDGTRFERPDQPSAGDVAQRSKKPLNPSSLSLSFRRKKPVRNLGKEQDSNPLTADLTDSGKQRSEQMSKSQYDPGPPLVGQQLEVLRHGSASKYLEPDGNGGWRFNAERQALHDEIIRKHVEGKTSRDNPVLTMTGGGSASGKGKVEKSSEASMPDKKSNLPGANGKDVVWLDSDEVKKLIPEYNEMLDANDPAAAAFAHQESKYLESRIQATAFANRFDVVIDGTGNGNIQTVRARVEAARDSGYSVNANYVTVDTELARKRADGRGKKEGRYIPAAVLVDNHTVVSRIFNDIYPFFDSINLFDNTAEGEDVPALLIARAKRGGELEVLDKEKFDAFIAKKDYVYDFVEIDGRIQAVLVAKGTEGVDLQIIDPEGYARVIEQRNRTKDS